MEWILFVICAMAIFGGGILVGYLHYSYNENADVLSAIGLGMLIAGIIGIACIHTHYSGEVGKENTNECICCS